LNFYNSSRQNKNQKLWSGVSDERNHELLDQFNSSLKFDYRLWECDLLGSLAHAQMLSEQKIIDQKDFLKIKAGILEIKAEIKKNPKAWIEKSDQEDIHLAVESRLTELIGSPAKKLHTARSRNDQVALDLKLWLRIENYQLQELLLSLLKTLLKLAERDLQVIMPGYTHLQHAQPVSLAHYWMAYYQKFNRDLSRLIEIAQRLEECPLGAGALAGTTYSIDRRRVADLLNFQDITKNSLDTVSDRDFVAEHLFVISLGMVHLSQLSEELIIWASEEFKFITLDNSFSTGSSMMPQKRNPDIPELIRGKTGRSIGNLSSLLIVLKALPLAYNKDLQEDKESLFDSVDTFKISVKIMNLFLGSLKINQATMKKSILNSFVSATDIADFLVNKGLAFRDAYQVTGKLIKYCLENKKVLSDFNLGQWKSFHQKFDEKIFEIIKPEFGLNSRASLGGTSPDQIIDILRNSWEEIKYKESLIKKKGDKKE